MLLWVTPMLLLLLPGRAAPTAAAEDRFSGESLIREVMANGSKLIRPVRDARQPTTVFFRLMLYQILGADSVQAKIHLHFWAEMLWKNEFVRWVPEEHGHISRIDLDVKHMWIPDVIFFTQLSGLHFNQNFPAPPALFSDGTVMVLKPFKAEIVCVMDVWYFPFDHQNCSFDVGSWAHLASEIDIRPKENGAADLMFFQSSASFHVRSFSGHYSTYSDPTLEGNNTMFSCLTYHLAFTRRAQYFVMNVILPSILINFLCVFNFIIPCETGEKVGYGITVFLAQSVNLMVVSEMMPQGGNSVLGMFLVASILLIALSLFMQILVMAIFFANSKTRCPALVRHCLMFLKNFVGPFRPTPATLDRSSNLPDELFQNITITHNGDLVPEPEDLEKEDEFPEFPGRAPSSSMRNINHQNLPRMANLEIRRASSLLGTRSRYGQKRMSICVPRQRTESFLSVSNNLSEILQHRRSSPLAESIANDITEEVEKEMEEVQIVEEWKLLANILNRFNGILFTAALSIVLGLYMYNHQP